MQYHSRNTIVIALGGSVVHPKEIDVRFVRAFAALLTRFLRRGRRFVLVVGGGALSRRLQEAASRIRRISSREKDWIGIQATRVNAHLVALAFGTRADQEVIHGASMVRRPTHPVVIASGWRPGWSTDYVAVKIAERLGLETAIIAGKPAYVYDKNPDRFRSAKMFPALSWREYRKLIPKKWSPGLRVPVDPVAARLAEKKKIRVIVVDGRNLTNFAHVLNGRDFRGTVIG